eukprot:CAMPEP_0203748098 /NCGR_PEP_ID=MMETSP0098-20131031/3062_1 /ASSEMBLY_ACC=CAM_ASM_000208 /TAXON_ID=96639 /ORGANISM=" , Strain NY0313808BC1" /LENGTH=78 /DNA_ID=CAMNT_0050636719 /DNA_START=19 /DNA_END=251 /DNA_ORIENTATION=+
MAHSLVWKLGSSRGGAHGGHPNVLQKEPAMAKVWTNYKASLVVCPYLCHGGHPNVLQKEPAMAKVWTNYKASPEIIPV